MRIVCLILSGAWFLLAGTLWGQAQDELTTGSRRAARTYLLAEEAYRAFNNQEAIRQLKRAVGMDADFIEAHLLMAEVYFSEEHFAESIAPYQKVVSLDPLFYPPAKYSLGVALYRTGDYEKAIRVLNKFVSMKDISTTLRARGGDYLMRARFAEEAKSNPVPFAPENPGRAINSEYAEYSPALTADEKTLIFTRKKPVEGYPADYGVYFEDFYISYFQNGLWTRAENLGPPLNTPGNEGAQTITADGRHLYFTACNRPDGLGSCDIYYATRKGGTWSTPVNPGAPLNSSAWDSQPSVSADGTTIYFSSNREGSKGPMDIWKATKNADGSWSKPENLGPVINTSGSEMSPFIHHDNRTLYFASDGHPGMGGLDIFYSRRDDSGQWAEPVNMGYPINTHGDEFSLIVGASGQRAWFASDKAGGHGETDLYVFELYPDARPHPHTYMKGIVTDAITGNPLSARFTIVNVDNEQLVTGSVSDPVDGSFLVALPAGQDLALNVSKDGYLFFSEHFSYAGLRTIAEPYLRNISLQPVGEGQSVVLRNVFFETDSHRLRESSRTELAELLRFMEENPGIHIEISGHTDSTGSFDYNMALSEKRAMSVRDFLTGQGIAKDRISYAGYADTQPVDTNETAEGRANNRRTEFRVVRMEKEPEEE